MEHRWSKRKALAGNVVMESARCGILLARLRDLSLHGMYVASGVIALPVYAPLVLTFSLARAKHLHHFRIEAMVVRATGNGIGLMFLDPEIATQRALRAALYETAPAPPVATCTATWDQTQTRRSHHTVQQTGMVS